MSQSCARAQRRPHDEGLHANPRSGMHELSPRRRSAGSDDRGYVAFISFWSATLYLGALRGRLKLEVERFSNGNHLPCLLFERLRGRQVRAASEGIRGRAGPGFPSEGPVGRVRASLDSQNVPPKACVVSSAPLSLCLGGEPTPLRPAFDAYRALQHFTVDGTLIRGSVASDYPSGRLRTFYPAPPATGGSQFRRTQLCARG